MAEKTWEELYKKYGIRQESSHKKTIMTALIIITVFMVIGIFLQSKPDMPSGLPFENNNSAGAQQNNGTSAVSGNTTQIQTDSFAVSYNYTNSKFVFFVKNVQQKSVETLAIKIDSIQSDYTISSGKLPLQYNETLQLSVSRQLCDKEHSVLISDGVSEQKITTYPLVCSTINR